MFTRGSYVYKPMVKFSGVSPPKKKKIIIIIINRFFFLCVCVCSNFPKYWQNNLQGSFLEFIKLYKQNQLEKFMFSLFTKTILWLESHQFLGCLSTIWLHSNFIVTGRNKMQIQDFNWGGGGAQKICTHAHYESETWSPFWQGSRTRLRVVDSICRYP